MGSQDIYITIQFPSGARVNRGSARARVSIVELLAYHSEIKPSASGLRFEGIDSYSICVIPMARSLTGEDRDRRLGGFLVMIYIFT